MPIRVPGLEDVVAISAGGSDYRGFALALASDGTVWAWGINDLGQLGDGTTTDRHSPRPVVGLDHVTAVAAGWSFSLALRDDGTVRAWGRNYEGQLGNGADIPFSATPLQVGGLYGVSRIAACNHGLALRPGPKYLRVEDGGGSIAYSDTWAARFQESATGGTAMYTDALLPGEASLVWQGTDVVVLMLKGPRMGMAWVTLDDQDSHLVDLYSPTLTYQQVVLQMHDLQDGPHQIVIAPGGQKNSYSGGYAIALDALDVR
jgi:hypothetical protein